MLGMAWIKCTEEAYKKCPFSNICGDAENAIFMDGSDCDKFNQSIKQTTVDAVPVVRCRDCKFWEPYGGKGTRNGKDPLEWEGGCMKWRGRHLESDFCSCGKRKVKNNA